MVEQNFNEITNQAKGHMMVLRDLSPVHVNAILQKPDLCSETGDCNQLMGSLEARQLASSHKIPCGV